MLVRGGASLIEPGVDSEGFSAGAGQFDSDITVGRYPRAALGLNSDELIAVVCDGRTEGEAGLDLAELAQAMIGLGADDAINLDGGGSASLVAGGELVNVPHEEHGIEIPGRPRHLDGASLRRSLRGRSRTGPRPPTTLGASTPSRSRS